MTLRSRSTAPWRSLSIAVLTYALVVTTTFGQAVAPKPASKLTADERAASSRIKLKTVREITTALADKTMEGRGTGQPGGDRAAKYIADKFAALGLKPLGDNGTFLQTIKFKSTELMPETSLKVGDGSLKLGEDYIPAPPYTAEKSSANANIIFVGYGVTSEALKRDDLAGVDVKDKIVLFLNGRPKDVDAAVWAREASAQAVAGNLLRRGVTGVLVANAGTERTSFSEIAHYLALRNVALVNAPTMPFKLPPILLISDPTAEKIFAGSELTYAQALQKAEAGEMLSRDLKKTGTIDLTVKRAEVTSSNVAGYIQGSDPKLNDQAVVYTAHYDAFGIDSSGRIYAGAADNALGVGEIMAIAEAFAKSSKKPRRSIIFLAVTAEEYGLYGAKHWADNPTWPIEKIAANVNLDGIGTEVYAPVKRIVGFGAEYSELGSVLEGVLSATGLILTADPLPEEGVFYRSDHYAFVKKGVPALMLLGGPEGDAAMWIARAQKWMKTDYHQPSDIVRPEWHWDGARTVAVVGLLLGMRVANADAVPQWLPTAPFKRARGAGEPPPSEKN